MLLVPQSLVYKQLTDLPRFKGKGIRVPFLVEEWQACVRMHETANSVIVFGKYNLPQTFFMTWSWLNVSTFNSFHFFTHNHVSPLAENVSAYLSFYRDSLCSAGTALSPVSTSNTLFGITTSCPTHSLCRLLFQLTVFLNSLCYNRHNIKFTILTKCPVQWH